MPVLTVEKPLRDSLRNDAAVDALVRLINEAQAEQKRDIVDVHILGGTGGGFCGDIVCFF